jgi:hypothetical protein
VSYDLHFLPPPGVDIEAEALLDYFAGRRRYEVGGSQAIYDNQRTGVYFIVDIGSDDGDEGTAGSVAAAFVNYVRPSFFIREIEPQIRSFVGEFDLSVYDPQGYMADGLYKPQLFTRGWREGNRSACLAHADSIQYTLPAATLNRAWEWNRAVPRLQKELSKTRDVCVPRVFFIAVDGLAATMTTWTEGIHIAVPEVDYLLIQKGRLAPRRLLKRTRDEGLVAVADAMPVFEKHRAPRSDDLLLLDYDRPPADVSAFVADAPMDERGFEPLSADLVIDAELVAS